ncbi:MAG: hypothetical protein IKB16_14260, partial [Lentisphaeria bacterium]|nr:hypothetical protein [Lentisphaeria bacterium]
RVGVKGSVLDFDSSQLFRTRSFSIVPFEMFYGISVCIFLLIEVISKVRQNLTEKRLLMR